MQYDCGFTKDNKWFRYRAAAIIVEEGCVLFAGNELDDYFYSIGGGGSSLAKARSRPSAGKCWRRPACPMKWTAWR